MSNPVFYTHCSRNKNNVYHTYIDGDGNKHHSVVRNFPYELFIEGKKEDSKSLDGKKLQRYVFDSISEMNDFVKKMKDVTDVYGNTNPVYQFIAGTYPNDIAFDIEKFTILNFDIECRVGENFVYDDSHIVTTHDDRKISLDECRVNQEIIVWDTEAEKDLPYLKSCYTKKTSAGFPEPHKAEQMVTAITCKVFGDNEKNYIFGLKEYKTKSDKDVYIKCNTEQELLIKFLSYYQKVKPDILTGWHISGFDILYLYNRINKIVGNDWGNRLSPYYKTCSGSPITVKEVHDKENVFDVDIVGVSIFDYLELYKKFCPNKQESYRLDFIATEEIGYGKLDYSDFDGLEDLYNRDFERYIDYNIKDTLLVEELDKKLKYILLALTIVYMGKTKLSDVFGQIMTWDCLIYNELKKENVQIPPQKRRESNTSIIGGYVKDPAPKRYDWVVSFDLTSLYPSIIMSWNMSPETITHPATGLHMDKMIGFNMPTQHIIDNNETLAANGARFTKSFHGILPRLMSKTFSQRKKYKDMMKEESKTLELIKTEMQKRNIVY